MDCEVWLRSTPANPVTRHRCGSTSGYCPYAATLNVINNPISTKVRIGCWLNIQENGRRGFVIPLRQEGYRWQYTQNVPVAVWAAVLGNARKNKVALPACGSWHVAHCIFPANSGTVPLPSIDLVSAAGSRPMLAAVVASG